MATQTSKPQTSKPATVTAPKVAEPQKSNKRERVNVDVASLTFVNAEAPVRQASGRKPTWKPAQPVLDAIQDSWDARKVLREYKSNDGPSKFTYIGSGKAVTVSEDQASATETLLRKHAAHLGLGLAVKRHDAGSGNVTISFAAKSPKESKGK